MLSGLAQFAAGHRTEGVEAFQRVESRGPFSKKDENQALANFFVETSQQMTSEHVIDPKATPVGSGGSFQTAAFLFYGIKDWEAGDVDEAAECFRRFRQAEFTGPDVWLDGLKPMATAYLEEYTSYQMASDGWRTAKTLDQKRAAVKALKAVQGKLAPKAQELAVTAAAEVAKVEKARAALLAQGKVPDGRYKLTNRQTGKTIEVENHGRDDGHKLQTATYSNAGSQQWHIVPQEGGYYLLLGVESNKALNVPKGMTDDGVALQQANVTKGPSQLWKIEKVENNFFKLTAQGSGKALAVGGADNGAPIIQTTYTNAPEQQWKIDGL
jgi:hypothetical protein